MKYEICVPQLGRLEIFEVYEFYDRPVLFACRNDLDHQFLAVLVEDTEDGETWLYIGMSQRRFYMVRSGGIDLHDAFAKAETGRAFLVKTTSGPEQKSETREVPVNEIPAEYFPEPGEYLQLATVTLLEIVESVSRKAKQSNRVHLKLHFDFQNILRSEAPAKFLGDVLRTLQDLLNSIGQAKKNEETSERGPYPKNILFNNEMLVNQMGGGSFVIELASANFNNLFEEADVEDTIEEFVTLLNIGSNAEPLKEKLQQLKIRVAANYLEFLEAISKDTKQTEVQWASPKPNREGYAKITTFSAKAAIGVIKLGAEEQTSTIEVIGLLVGANIRSHIYDLEVSEKEKFSGKISPEAMDYVEGAVLGRAYKASIRVVDTLKPTTGEVETKYELISLTLIEPNLPCEK